MVNFQVENTNAQAVVASEGMATTGNLMAELDKLESKPEMKKGALIKELIESGPNRELGNRLLKDIMTKVAQTGVIFEGLNPQGKIQGEGRKLGRQTSLNVDEGADTIDLSTSAGEDQPVVVRGIGKKSARLQQQVSQQWQDIEEQLVKDGKGREEISRMEMQYKSSETQKHLLNLLRESAISYYLEDKRMGKMIRKRGFSQLLDIAGKELGRKAASEAQLEVRSFVLQELENELILRSFKQDGEFSKCYKLIRAGQKVGDDPMSWIDTVWEQKKENLGLNFLDVPQQATGVMVDVRSDQDMRRQREEYDFTDKDEKDVVLNRLRALYMQLVLKPGALRSLSTWFKIRKLKNGMVRLGVFTKDVDEKLKSEAKTLAKLKTMEMLEEALHERAAIFADGAAKDMMKNKIKNCLKMLERLGFELSDQNFVVLRDKANRHMYDLVSKEMDKAKKSPSPLAEQKVAMLKKLSTKLSEESNLGLREEA
ncbi:MAG: hypothetical protein HQ596_02630 [Candidatus Saganbacteria bacterium]|nr:hypothetical protein [Candidatus Saganbacteria bacterium]